MEKWTFCSYRCKRNWTYIPLYSWNTSPKLKIKFFYLRGNGVSEGVDIQRHSYISSIFCISIDNVCEDYGDLKTLAYFLFSSCDNNVDTRFKNISFNFIMYVLMNVLRF